LPSSPHWAPTTTTFAITSLSTPQPSPPAQLWPAPATCLLYSISHTTRSSPGHPTLCQAGKIKPFDGDNPWSARCGPMPARVTRESPSGQRPEAACSDVTGKRRHAGVRDFERPLPQRPPLRTLQWMVRDRAAHRALQCPGPRAKHSNRDGTSPSPCSAKKHGLPGYRGTIFR
jgi:hypothetical protein